MVNPANCCNKNVSHYSYACTEPIIPWLRWVSVLLSASCVRRASLAPFLRRANLTVQPLSWESPAGTRWFPTISPVGDRYILGGHRFMLGGQDLDPFTDLEVIDH